MFGILIIALISGFLTTAFIVAEIHWSLQNVFRLWHSHCGIGKLKVIPLIPFCFLPVVWDVIITLGMTFLFGLEGMMGIMVSMLASSVVAGYLFIQRRRNGWHYA